MKRLATKIMAACTAAALCAACLPVNAAVTAADAYPDYTLYLASGEDRADTIYVSEEDVANGDVVIPVSIFMESDPWTDPCITYMYYTWKSSDWNSVRFQNIIDYGNPITEQTFTYSGGTFTAKYEPFMLAPLVNKRGTVSYTSANFEYYGREFMVDPRYGEQLYYDGNGNVYFEASYYASEEDKTNKNKTVATINLELTPLEDGSADFSYEYVRQDNYQVDTATGNIPFYEPESAAETKVKDRCNRLLWMTTSETTEFVGASDEFHAASFEAVVLQGTPAGTYTVSLIGTEKNTYMNEENYIPSATRDLTIIVGESAETTTTTEETTTTTEETTTTTEEITTTEEPTTTTTEKITTTASTTAVTTTTVSKTSSSSSATETSTSATTVKTTASTTTIATTTSVTLTNADDAPYLSETTLILRPGMEHQLSVFNTAGEDVVWNTNDDEIASISEDGIIHANNPGSTQIFTIIRNKVLYCNVTVVDSLCGDVNLDGKISLGDAVQLNKFVSGIISLNETSLYNSDCLDDNTVIASDAVILLKHLAGIIEALPFTE